MPVNEKILFRSFQYLFSLKSIIYAILSSAMLRENHAVFLGKKYRFPRGGGGINIRFVPKYGPGTTLTISCCRPPRRVLEYQADLDAQVAKEMAWREDDQEYIRRRDALFARNLQVQCPELRFALPPLKELSHEFGSGHAQC